MQFFLETTARARALIREGSIGAAKEVLVDGLRQNPKDLYAIELLHELQPALNAGDRAHVASFVAAVARELQAAEAEVCRQWRENLGAQRVYTRSVVEAQERWLAGDPAGAARAMLPVSIKGSTVGEALSVVLGRISDLYQGDWPVRVPIRYGRELIAEPLLTPWPGFEAEPETLNLARERSERHLRALRPWWDTIRYARGACEASVCPVCEKKEGDSELELCARCTGLAFRGSDYVFKVSFRQEKTLEELADLLSDEEIEHLLGLLPRVRECQASVSAEVLEERATARLRLAEQEAEVRAVFDRARPVGAGGLVAEGRQRLEERVAEFAPAWETILRAREDHRELRCPLCGRAFEARWGRCLRCDKGGWGDPRLYQRLVATDAPLRDALAVLCDDEVERLRGLLPRIRAHQEARSPRP